MLFLKERCNQGLIECIFKDDEMKPPLASLSHLPKTPTKIEDDRAKVQDLLKKVKLGTKDDPKPLFISKCYQLSPK